MIKERLLSASLHAVRDLTDNSPTNQLTVRQL